MSEPAEKIVLLEAWIEVIKKDLETLNSDREIKFKEYRRLKEIYDKRTSAKLKHVTKIDKFIVERKKAMAEVEKEIKILSEPPTQTDIEIVVQPEPVSAEIVIQSV